MKDKNIGKPAFKIELPANNMLEQLKKFKQREFYIIFEDGTMQRVETSFVPEPDPEPTFFRNKVYISLDFKHVSEKENKINCDEKHKRNKPQADPRVGRDAPSRYGEEP